MDDADFAFLTSISATLAAQIANIQSGVAGLVQVQNSITGWIATGVQPASLTITSVSPLSGPVGASVTFTGTGFGANQGSGSVLMGVETMPITSWSDTSVVATVPTEFAAGDEAGFNLTTGGLGHNLVYGPPYFTVTSS